MAVVRISGLPQGPGVDPGSVLKRLCLRLAEVDSVDARHWWATWQPIAPDAYFEGDVQAPAVQPGASHPPIVEILSTGGVVRHG